MVLLHVSLSLLPEGLRGLCVNHASVSTSMTLNASLGTSVIELFSRAEAYIFHGL